MFFLDNFVKFAGNPQSWNPQLFIGDGVHYRNLNYEGPMSVLGKTYRSVMYRTRLRQPIFCDFTGHLVIYFYRQCVSADYSSLPLLDLIFVLLDVHISYFDPI